MKSKYVKGARKSLITEQGLRNISIANTKTGLWSCQVRADRRKCRELMRDGQAVLEEAQKALL